MIDYTWLTSSSWSDPWKKNIKNYDCCGWTNGAISAKTWNEIYDSYLESYNKTYDEILKHIAKTLIKEKVEINENDIMNLLKDDD